MRNKKKAETKKTPEQEALEQSVDAIMDPKQPDKAAVASVSPPVAETPVVAAADTGAKTAPQLSTKLRKQISVADVPTAPLSIDKLDELTESIAKAEPETEPETEPEPEPAAKPETKDEPEKIPESDATDRSTELDDAKTDEAVDNIVAYESDVMLAIADSTVAERQRQAEGASGKKSTHHPIATFIWTLIFILAILAIIATILLVSGGNLPGLRNY